MKKTETEFEQQLELKKYRRALLIDLQECRDKYVQQGLLAELADVDRLLGRAPIDIALLGQRTQPTNLEDLT